jgi:TIR domain
MPGQTPSRPVTLFYSYAYEDEDLRKQLEDHLRLLQRKGLLSFWHNRAIRPGDNRAGEIDNHLNSADIILLLVSVAFLASDYLYEIEMHRALERHQRGDARVIPIILRDCDWSNAPFADLQVLPKDGRSVTTYPNRDKVWTDVTRGIREVLEKSEVQQLQLRSISPSNLFSGKHLRQRIVFLVGTIMLFALLLSVSLWRYVPSIRGISRDIPHKQVTITRQAVVTTVSGTLYTVKNTSEELPDGVYFRQSLQIDPGQPTPTPIYGFGVFKADAIQISCWAWSDDVSNDKIWYYVYNVTRQTVAGRENRGWISAHYVNDGMTANHPTPGIPPCGNPLPTGG